MQGLQHPPCWGCTCGYARADSATTSDKDLQGHCVLWGRAQKLRPHQQRTWGPWDAQLCPRGAGACSIPGLFKKGCRWCQKSWTQRFLGYMLHRKSQLRETLSVARKPGSVAAGWVTLQQLTSPPLSQFRALSLSDRCEMTNSLRQSSSSPTRELRAP